MSSLPTSAGRGFIEGRVHALSHADDEMVKRVRPEDFKTRVANHEDLFGRDMRFTLIPNYADIGIPDLVPRDDLQAPR